MVAIPPQRRKHGDSHPLIVFLSVDSVTQDTTEV